MMSRSLWIFSSNYMQLVNNAVKIQLFNLQIFNLKKFCDVYTLYTAESLQTQNQENKYWLEIKDSLLKPKKAFQKNSREVYNFTSIPDSDKSEMLSCVSSSSGYSFWLSLSSSLSSSELSMLYFSLTSFNCSVVCFRWLFLLKLLWTSVNAFSTWN